MLQNSQAILTFISYITFLTLHLLGRCSSYKSLFYLTTSFVKNVGGSSINDAASTRHQMWIEVVTMKTEGDDDTILKYIIDLNITGWMTITICLFSFEAHHISLKMKIM